MQALLKNKQIDQKPNKMNKLILMCLTIVLTTSCTNNNTKPNQELTEVVTDVNVNQFKNLITEHGGIILDVRTPEEWAEGTIANAEKINYYSDNFANEIEKLDKKSPVFVYCKKGGRSSSAAEVLEEKGFTKVYNLDGGITAWIDAGNETVK